MSIGSGADLQTCLLRDPPHPSLTPPPRIPLPAPLLPPAVSVDGEVSKVYLPREEDPQYGWWTSAANAPPNAPFASDPFYIILLVVLPLHGRGTAGVAPGVTAGRWQRLHCVRVCEGTALGSRRPSPPCLPAPPPLTALLLHLTLQPCMVGCTACCAPVSRGLRPGNPGHCWQLPPG
jgi:hypothetical protein